MSGVVSTIYASSVTFAPTNGDPITWLGQGGSATGTGYGGPIAVSYGNDSDAIKDRTGDDFYPSAVLVANGDLTVSVTLRSYANTITLGTEGKLFCQVEGKYDGSVTIQTVSFANGTGSGGTGNAVLYKVDGDQARANLGGCVLWFTLESAFDLPPLTAGAGAGVTGATGPAA